VRALGREAAKAGRAVASPVGGNIVDSLHIDALSQTAFSLIAR